MRSLPPVFQCSICLVDHQVDGCCTLPCGHRFCFDSLQHHFAIFVKERRLDQLRCPLMDCMHKVEDVEILRGCLDKEVFEKLLEFMTRDISDPNIIDCPFCEERIWLADNDDRTNLVCPQAHVFCADCANGPHPFLSCKEQEDFILRREIKLREREEQKEAQSIAMSLGWKPCPKLCKFGGGYKASEECDHVTCQCGFQFCWMCGVDRRVVVAHDNRWHKPECPYYTKREEVSEDLAFSQDCPACQSLCSLGHMSVCPFPESDGYPNSVLSLKGVS